MGSKQWTRLDLLTAMDKIWSKHLNHISALSIKQQTANAQRSGYLQPKDLIAHLAVWMAETVSVIPYLRLDERPPRDYANDDAFNALVIERCHRLPRPEVATEFRRQRLALRKLTVALPDDAFQVARVYRWLSSTIIGHSQDHQVLGRSLVGVRHIKQSNKGSV